MANRVRVNTSVYSEASQKLGDKISEYRQKRAMGVPVCKLHGCEEDIRALYWQLQQAKYDACHHEFLVDQGVCCRCGVERTPETELAAEERRHIVCKSKKREAIWSGMG